MEAIRLLLAPAFIEQILLPPMVVPMTCAMERHTSAAIPNPKALLLGSEQRLPSSLISFTLGARKGGGKRRNEDKSFGWLYIQNTEKHGGWF